MDSPEIILHDPLSNRVPELPLIWDDLVKADQHGIMVICQQNNCVTRSARGLAQHIAQQLGVNPYIDRSILGERIPGRVEVMPSPHRSIVVANMYAQYNPGKSARLTNISTRDAFNISIEDTPEQRLGWFRLCCQTVHIWLKQSNLTQIGVPYMIGCGLAGGNWTDYLQIIREELPEAVLFRLP